VNRPVVFWASLLLLAVELALFAFVALHLDAGLKTEIRDGQPFGTCLEKDFEIVGLAWLAMTSTAFVGALLSLFKKSKWLWLAAFVLPVIVATTLAKYQEDRFPACWERPAENAKS